MTIYFSNNCDNGILAIFILFIRLFKVVFRLKNHLLSFFTLDGAALLLVGAFLVNLSNLKLRLYHCLLGFFPLVFLPLTRRLPLVDFLAVLFFLLKRFSSSLTLSINVLPPCVRVSLPPKTAGTSDTAAVDKGADINTARLDILTLKKTRARYLFIHKFSVYPRMPK